MLLFSSRGISGHSDRVTRVAIKFKERNEEEEIILATRERRSTGIVRRYVPFIGTLCRTRKELAFIASRA